MELKQAAGAEHPIMNDIEEASPGHHPQILDATKHVGSVYCHVIAMLFDEFVTILKGWWRPHGDSNPGTYRERVVS